jgi:hypothetical protein
MREAGIWLSRKEWQVIRTLLHVVVDERGEVVVQPSGAWLYPLRGDTVNNGLTLEEGGRLVDKLGLRGVTPPDRINLSEDEFFKRYRGLDVCQRPAGPVEEP